MAGSLLASQPCRIRNVPDLVDVARMGQILTALGVGVRRSGSTLELDPSQLDGGTPPYELVSRLRASFFPLGPLLARLGQAQLPLPGGCAIGARPVDLHVRGLQAMGAQIRIEGGMVRAAIPGRHNRLQGGHIHLDYPSVGATETLIMAAVLAQGETTIDNAAQEPEIADLADFCCAMGARIQGAGTSTVTVSGTDGLQGVDRAIMPDRIEAGTFLVAGALTGSQLTLSPTVPEHLGPIMAKLHEIGVEVVRERADCLRVLPGELSATDIETAPYPGFPTDMQAQFMVLLALSSGDSVITETVFEHRLAHVPELQRMGANIRVKDRHAIIRGVPKLSGAPIEATDLRASAALVLAGLAAEGVTTVMGLHHLDRGYENLEGKLRQLGAQLQRVPAAAASTSARAPTATNA